MYKKNFILELINGFRSGIRIAASMVTASLRTWYMLCMLFFFNVFFLLYYFDVIHRTLFAGGSSIEWALICTIKRWGFSLPLHVFGVEWLLHFPEYFLLFSVFALLSLMMVHITHNSLEHGACGVGRALFRALRAWRFIFVYALCMSSIVWIVGDVQINSMQWMLTKISETPTMMASLYDPIYGKKMIDLLLYAPYWLSIKTRLAISIVWYIGTFLLFPIVAIEQCSFFAGLKRSCVFALQNIGLVMSAALFYLLLYSGVLVATLYGQAATLPSLAGLGMKSSVQVIVLFSFMTLILFTVHAALISSGALITGVCVYRMATHQRMPLWHPIFIARPYWSCSLYLMFYIFYWIIIRCGIHVQMPKI